MLIYYYNHHKQADPDLINSWDLIYNYAKQNKQNIFFQTWVTNIKNNIYISMINE